MRQNPATLLGIGAQKCASTWAHGVFGQCPDIALADEKEVDFFSYWFDRGYEWYERRFPDTPARHRAEISPSYFIHPAAPERVAAYNPEMRILVCLRDPVGRAFSNHLHEARKGHVSGANLDFETALDNNPLYLDQGRYAGHLARWLDHFPRDRVLVLFQEEIQADRSAAARRLTDWLDLPPIGDFLDRNANESVRYRNAALGQALWRVGRAARGAGLGRAVETAKALPGIRQIRASNRQSMRDVVAPMRPETEARLTGIFAPEVARLEALLERQVPWPRFRPA